MDVAEEPSLGGRQEERPAVELAVRPTSCRSAAASEEVGAEARVELRGLPAERGHGDGVLEQAAGPGVVRRRASPGGRGAARGSRRRRRTRPTSVPQARVGDLGGEELEEAVQLVEVPATPRERASPGSSSAGSSDRTSSWSRSRNRSTRPSTRTASPSPKRWSSSSTSSQTRASIRPLGSTSSSARYGLPVRVRSRCLRATAKRPSTTRSSASSAIGTASPAILGPRDGW